MRLSYEAGLAASKLIRILDHTGAGVIEHDPASGRSEIRTVTGKRHTIGIGDQISTMMNPNGQRLLRVNGKILP